MTHVVIIAGEASGDRIGAGLIRALRLRDPGLRISGVAGPEMRAAGCEAWFDSESLAVMGLVEVLRHLPRLRRLFHQLEQRLLEERPDVVVGIDAPDFNLRLLPRARAAGIRTVQYVAPTVWAWRPGRVKVLRAACDRVLCLFPFEPGFLAAHGISARFVGHPLAETLAEPPAPEQCRRELGLPAGPLLGLLPGSRQAELQKLGPAFAATAAWLTARLPGLHCVAPMASPALADLFREALATHAPGVACTVIEGRSHEAMRASDVLLMSSGTATLEGMLLERPMVVAYRIAPLTWFLLRGLKLVRVEHIAMPNLLAGERLLPEFLQGEVRPERLGPAVERLFSDAALREATCQRLRGLGRQLRGDADSAAAEAVLELVPGFL
ncbi:MAG: lipid-A-disaccharide synthase [Chromatiales bacterium]|nr:lipid-A-disaccharide synthase [Chromatiales bacterium]